MLDRRRLLSLAPAAALAGVLAPAHAAVARAVAMGTLFEPRRFGAKADGRTLDTDAINRAIDAANKAGGGTVYLAGGSFLTGTVFLKSNVTLYIEAGATLLGSTDINQYIPQPGPDAHVDANQRHLIFARDVQNITIAGSGTIDGQGRSFWQYVKRDPVPEELQWRDASHNDWKRGERASPMLEIVGCTDVRIEGVTITGASGWTIRPINCTRLFVSQIHISNPAYGPNTDGIDVTGCQDVVISDCVIETGDDAICLKSENPYGAAPRLSKNIVVTNCVIKSETNGFKIGTATKGGFEDITFSNSVISPAGPALNERVIAGIALECVDGGWVEGVVITGIEMDRARAPIFIRRGDRGGDTSATANRLSRVTIDNVRARGAVLTSSITGLPDRPVEDVRLSNIDIETVMPGKPSWIAGPIPEIPAKYPESRMFGWLPASGFFCRHVVGLRMRDIRITAPLDEWRTTMLFDDVTDSSVSGFSSTPAKDGVAPFTYRDVANASIRESVAPRGAGALVALQGANRNVVVAGCELNGASPAAGAVGGVVRATGNIR